MNKQWLYDRLLGSSGKRKTILVSIDILFFLFMSAAYHLFSSVGNVALDKFAINTAIHLVLFLAARAAFSIYSNVWRYSNTKAYFYIVLSDAIAALLSVLVSYVLGFAIDGVYTGIWRAMSVGSLTAMLTLVSRFLYTIIYKALSGDRDRHEKKPIAIIGAGRLGAYLVGDLENNPNSQFKPCFFVDTDEAKIGCKVAGVEVCAPADAQRLIEERGVRTVIVAIARADKELLSNIYSKYTELDCKVLICETLGGGVENKPKIRDFTIEDLLFRAPIKVNEKSTFDFYCDKTILVTGGGGSIGSELCRQIASCKPRRLVIFDIYENNAYDIQQELVRKYGDELDLAVEIGSVRDVARLEELFATHRPQIVFHAAAHKHVPLMEHSPAETVKNNCLGTYNTANMAEKYGADKFILISTDKAVNPTNIMGASKRMCEMIIQCRTDSSTRFVAVRFGNVLGSNGSVIPLFKRQIENGGPVTITDKNIIRYFMTIPEASGLVLQAGAMAKRGELFVLDMGKPIRIYDLALQMIKMSGYKPHEDIEIKEIGLRPGEKLYEELLLKVDEMEKTENDLIFIEHCEPLSREEVDAKLELLTDAMRDSGNCGDAVKHAMAEAVPTYVDPDIVNRLASESEEMKLATSK